MPTSKSPNSCPTLAPAKSFSVYADCAIRSRSSSSSCNCFARCNSIFFCRLPIPANQLDVSSPSSSSASPFPSNFAYRCAASRSLFNFCRFSSARFFACCSFCSFSQLEPAAACRVSRVLASSSSEPWGSSVVDFLKDKLEEELDGPGRGAIPSEMRRRFVSSSWSLSAMLAVYRVLSTQLTVDFYFKLGLGV